MSKGPLVFGLSLPWSVLSYLRTFWPIWQSKFILFLLEQSNASLTNCSLCARMTCQSARMGMLRNISQDDVSLPCFGLQGRQCHLDWGFCSYQKCSGHSQYCTHGVSTFATFFQQTTLVISCSWWNGDGHNTSFCILPNKKETKWMIWLRLFFDLGWYKKYQAHLNWSDCGKFENMLHNSSCHLLSWQLRVCFLCLLSRNMSSKQ